MRGRRNPHRPQGNALLPPCRVCGEKGSGFHYGVTTCGACKGFFRRSLVRSEPYVCMTSHLCQVGPATSRRQSCPKCRYDKCISVGMSKDACKVGRYSLVKKSKDIAEMLSHQMDGGDGSPSFLENTDSLAKIVANGLDLDPNSSDTVISSSQSPNFTRIPSFQTPPTARSDRKAMPTSTFDFMNESDRLSDTYCQVSPHTSSEEGGLYSDMDSDENLSYSAPYQDSGQHFESNLFPKPDSFPEPVFGATSTSTASFLHIGSPLVDSFPDALQTPGFVAQEPNFTVLEPANIPQYPNPTRSSLVEIPPAPPAPSAEASSPLQRSSLPSIITARSAEACNVLDATAATHTCSMLTSPIASFNPVNIPSTLGNASHVTSTSSSYDLRLSPAPITQTQGLNFSNSSNMNGNNINATCNNSSSNNHHHHHHHHNNNNNNSQHHNFMAVDDDQTVTSNFLGVLGASFDPIPLPNTPTTLPSSLTMPQNQMPGSQPGYPPPAPINSSRNFSIDELIAQSIHTDSWSDSTWVDNLQPSASQTAPGGPISSAPSFPLKDKSDISEQAAQSFGGSSDTLNPSSTPPDMNFGLPALPSSSRTLTSITTPPMSNDIFEDNFLSSSSSSSENDKQNALQCVPTPNHGVGLETALDKLKSFNGLFPQSTQVAKKDGSLVIHDKDNNEEDNGLSNTTTAHGNPNSFYLLFICPELAPFGLTMYEQFPFASYEGHCLRPLLNSCVDPGENLRMLMSDANQIQSCLDLFQEADANLSLCPRLEASQSPAPCSSPGTSAIANLLNESKFQMTFSEQDLEMTLSNLLALHERMVGEVTNSMTDMEITTAQDIFKGICKLRDRLHGPIQFIEDHVYKTVFHSTGVDLDKRREILGLYITQINANMPKAIRFFRSVPGFNSLSMCDRITMARGAMYEYYILSNYRGCDRDSEVLINLECLLAARFSTFEKLFPDVGLALKHAQRTYLRLNALDLSMEELVLMKAFCLTHPRRRDELENPLMAERLHQKFLSCLLNYLKKARPQRHQERFVELTSALKEIVFVAGMLHQSVLANQEMCLLLLKEVPADLCKEAMWNVVSRDRHAFFPKLFKDKVKVKAKAIASITEIS